MMPSSTAKMLRSFHQEKNGYKIFTVYKMRVAAGATKTIYCRLTNKLIDNPFARGFKDVFDSTQTGSR